jgi:signal peptidase
MYPALRRGDGIIIKKLSDQEKDNLQVDDIIAFYEGDVIVTHRIIRIDNGEELQFITKGDNNNTKDITKQKKDDIIGIVIIRIPLIGYPSIELNEMVNKRE